MERAATVDASTGGGGWSGMMLEGEGRFANRPYGGVVERLNVTGDDEGRP